MSKVDFRGGIITALKLICIAAGVCLITLASQYLVALVFRLIFAQSSISNSVLQTIFTICADGLTIFILIFLLGKVKKSWKTDKSELGLLGLPTWTDLGLAPVAFIVYTFVAAVITQIFAAFPWFDATETQDVGFNGLLIGVDRYLAFFSLVIVAPVAEEIIFRGFLYGKLKKHLGKYREITAIIITTLLTSLAFGIMHGQWNVGVNVFVMSIFLCALREITGSIYAGILMHMLKNALAFFLLYLVGMGF